MTKAEMVDAVAKVAGITKKAAQAALEALTELITKDLKKGNNVVITGFGTFRVSKRNARSGVNPRQSVGKDQDPGDERAKPSRRPYAESRTVSLKKTATPERRRSLFMIFAWCPAASSP